MSQTLVGSSNALLASTSAAHWDPLLLIVPPALAALLAHESMPPLPLLFPLWAARSFPALYRPERACDSGLWSPAWLCGHAT